MEEWYTAIHNLDESQHIRRKLRLFTVACLRSKHLGWSPSKLDLRFGMMAEKWAESGIKPKFGPYEEPDHNGAAWTLRDYIKDGANLWFESDTLIHSTKVQLLTDILYLDFMEKDDIIHHKRIIDSVRISCEAIDLAQGVYDNTNCDGIMDKFRISLLHDEMELIGNGEITCSTCDGKGEVEYCSRFMYSCAELGYDTCQCNSTKLCEQCKGKKTESNPILDHLKENVNHVKGCWVIDLIRGLTNGSIC